MHMPVKTLSAAVAAALMVVACGKKEEPKPVAQTPGAPAAAAPLVVKLGHSAPLTGPQAHIGKDNENGARMAVGDANAAGIKIGDRPLTIELQGEDDQADPKQGILVAQKLVDAKVNAVIGHLNSGTTIPASKIYADAGIPQVSPSATNPTYTHQGFKTAFRVMANDVQQGKVLGEFAAHQMGGKKIARFDFLRGHGSPGGADGQADEGTRDRRPAPDGRWRLHDGVRQERRRRGRRPLLLAAGHPLREHAGRTEIHRTIQGEVWRDPALRTLDTIGGVAAPAAAEVKPAEPSPAEKK